MCNSNICVIANCTNTQELNSALCSQHIAESKLPASVAGDHAINSALVAIAGAVRICHVCKVNPSADDVRYHGMCTDCYQKDCELADASPDMDCPDHWCEKHQINTGEGDICHKCEIEFADYRGLINYQMTQHQYELFFVIKVKETDKMYRCEVGTFDEAKQLFHSLPWATGVRIARFDEEQGCESVLHKFS